jgi:bacteriocin-like protein
MADNEKQVRDDEKQEISEKDMESVSGGVREGGCIPPIFEPFEPVPTFPVDY